MNCFGIDENNLHIDVKKRFPFIFKPLPVRANSFAYVDYVPKGDGNLLILPTLLKRPYSIKYDIFSNTEYPKIAIVCVQVEKCGEESTLLMIDNIPQKIRALYGEEALIEYFDLIEQSMRGNV